MLKSELEERLEQATLTLKSFSIDNLELKNQAKINTKELERLTDAEVKVAELRINNTKLSAQLHTYTKEVEGLNEQIKYNSELLHQINWSIHTMMQVKYPDNKPMDLSPGAVNAAWVPDTEEKTFLMFLQELSSRRSYNVSSASDLFRHMS